MKQASHIINYRLIYESLSYRAITTLASIFNRLIFNREMHTIERDLSLTINTKSLQQNVYIAQ